MRASGAVPTCRALAAVVTTSAAAPSLIPEALPAVTVPSFLNAGFSFRQRIDGGAGTRVFVDREDDRRAFLLGDLDRARFPP